jgi:folate-binding protein YgfZ
MEKLDKVNSIELTDWDIIQVSGPDSLVFLQNLLTIDVAALETSEGLAQGGKQLKLGGFCTPQGRLLATFWLSRKTVQDVDTFCIWISKDIAQDIATKLTRYILRSKVTIQYSSEKYLLLGTIVDKTVKLATHEIGTNDFVISLPDVLGQGICFARTIQAIPKNTNLLIKKNSSKIELWNRLEVESGLPRIVASTQGLFVPQMVNLESIGGIDFKKGCYPGQEIIARSQYRGTIKRRLKIAELLTNQENKNPKPGDEIYSVNNLDQPVGVVVLSAQDDESNASLLQVELKIDELNSPLVFKNTSGLSNKLKIKNPPYPLLDI